MFGQARVAVFGHSIYGYGKGAYAPCDKRATMFSHGHICCTRLCTSAWLLKKLQSCLRRCSTWTGHAWNGVFVHRHWSTQMAPCRLCVLIVAKLCLCSACMSTRNSPTHIDLSLCDGVIHNVNLSSSFRAILAAVARRTPSPNVAACKNKHDGLGVVFTWIH